MSVKEVKIDLDLRDARKRFAAVRRVGWMFRLTAELFGWEYFYIGCKRSRHGVHVSAWVRGDISGAEIVALQLACGSDEVREILNLRRVRDPAFRGTGAWNVLFDERVKEFKGRAPDRFRAYDAPELTRALIRKMEGDVRHKNR